jgi:gliding motility-associated-like protein
VNGIDIKSYTLRIFNRWGQQVFQTSDMTKGWTGFTDNKKEIITEVFVYQLEYTLNSGRRGEKIGTVTLVR